MENCSPSEKSISNFPLFKEGKKSQENCLNDRREKSFFLLIFLFVFFLSPLRNKIVFFSRFRRKALHWKMNFWGTIKSRVKKILCAIKRFFTYLLSICIVNTFAFASNWHQRENIVKKCLGKVCWMFGKLLENLY